MVFYKLSTKTILQVNQVSFYAKVITHYLKIYQIIESKVKHELSKLFNASTQHLKL